nr:DUF3145 family protein [Angustibacter aerolatus]
MVFVHSAPSALCPHVEWAVGAVLGVRVRLDWTAQPAEAAAWRTEPVVAGRTRHGRPPGVGAARLGAAALRGHRGAVRARRRRPLEPHPGPRRAPRGGRPARRRAGGRGPRARRRRRRERRRRAAHRRASTACSAGPGTTSLEPFRYAGDGAPVRWLHRVG